MWWTDAERRRGRQQRALGNLGGLSGGHDRRFWSGSMLELLGQARPRLMPAPEAPTSLTMLPAELADVGNFQ